MKDIAVIILKLLDLKLENVKKIYFLGFSGIIKSLVISPPYCKCLLIALIVA